MANTLIDKITPGKGNKTVRTIILIAIVILVIVIIYQVYKAITDSGKALGEIVGMEIIQQKTGIVPARQRVCKEVAENCANAITRLWLIGSKLWVDDDEIVDQLNRLLTPAEAALTCVFFKESEGESLKSVVEGGYFVEKNRSRITLRNYLV